MRVAGGGERRAQRIRRRQRPSRRRAGTTRATRFKPSRVRELAVTAAIRDDRRLLQRRRASHPAGSPPATPQTRRAPAPGASGPASTSAGDRKSSPPGSQLARRVAIAGERPPSRARRAAPRAAAWPTDHAHGRARTRARTPCWRERRCESDSVCLGRNARYRATIAAAQRAPEVCRPPARIGIIPGMQLGGGSWSSHAPAVLHVRSYDCPAGHREVRDLGGEVGRGQVGIERRADRRAGQCRQLGAQQTDQHPVAVNGRVPVEAAVERRVQLARAAHIGVAVDDVLDRVASSSRCTQSVASLAKCAASARDRSWHFG